MPFTAAELSKLGDELEEAGAAPGIDADRSRDQRRAQGAFFTPEPLVRFTVRSLLDAFLSTREVRWHEDEPALRILDPAAGDGRFLLAARDHLVGRGAPPSAVERSLIAIERDPDYARALRERLGPAATVHCREALLSEVVADGSVDLVLGNPPYLRSIHLGAVDEELRQRLRGRYAATSLGEWDLYAAFLEQGLRWLRPGGQLALVLPSRWWTARWAAPLRGLLARTGALRALVDFGATQIFPGATVYTSLCFAARDAMGEVRLARRGASSWLVVDKPSEQFAEPPWGLALGAAGEVVEALRSSGRPLGSVARIAKGTGTNADRIFVVGAGSEVERELLVPVLRGRDVRAYGKVEPWPRLLVPYRRDGSLIPPELLRSQFPRAHAYLGAQRARLEAREKGRFAGDHFYCFGRPQNLRFLFDPAAKIVVPDIAREGRALLDRSGAMVLDSAYALRLQEEHPADFEESLLEGLCVVLNAPVVAFWLHHHGLPLRGGYTRMKTAYLRDLPVPPADQLASLGRARLRGDDPGSLRERVRLAYGLDQEQWAEVLAVGASLATA